MAAYYLQIAGILLAVYKGAMGSRARALLVVVKQ
jgi:hypothetical protein